MLTGLLLTVNVLVCLALIGVVLLQKSEGGALGSGGGPTGLITSRGAGDLLTRTTWVLFTVFLTLSLALTLLGGHARSDQAAIARFKSLSINPDAHRTVPPPAQPAGQVPASGQTTQAPVQLPPLSGAPGPQRHTSQAAPASSTPNSAPASPLALPPLAPETPAKPAGAP